MKILLVEPKSDDATFLVAAVHEKTAARFGHAHTPQEGVSQVLNAHGAIDLVILTFRDSPSDVINFASDLRNACNTAFIRTPTLIALAESATASAAAKLIAMNIPVYLRSSIDGICFGVAAILSRIRLSGNGPLWAIRHCQGSYQLFMQGTAVEKQICVGDKVVKLARLLSGGLDAYPLDEVARTLGVCRQSVKKYMRDLRKAYDIARVQVGIIEAGSAVVWMKRGSGGTLCGLGAHVVWG